MRRKVFKNISELLTFSSAAQKKGRKPVATDLSIIKKAAMVVESGKVLWLGSQKSIPKEFAKKATEIDLQGLTVLPGFVECHTHSLFAGSRSHEFEQRNQGVSYQEINAKGGGIRSTMRKTREASSKKLQDLLNLRIENFIQQGVTTLEVKTGYALDEKNELRCLKILNSAFPITIVPTYLGAHALPPEFSTAEEYLKFSLEKVLPKIKKYCQRVDLFIEKGFFDANSECEKYLQEVRRLGFDLAVHADQLSFSGASELALKYGAISADHMIQTNVEMFPKIAKSDLTCVLLPAADLYMKCAYPKARQMIDEGCRVALATDYNPGSCPTQDLNLVGLLARLEMKMTLPEVLVAYTVGASHALGRHTFEGSLEVGKSANFVGIKKDWDQLFYSAGERSVSTVFSLGRKIT